MRILGVIAEYNPFHAGHAYHLKRTRALSGCDYVIAAMSGSFSQRGDPMILDKWTRARMALSCGADLVLELPALYAVRSAESFARGGVRLLAEVGANALSFGCETDDLALLHRLAQLREEESPALAELIRKNLSAGQSHPRARGAALGEYTGASEYLLRAPNAALAVEYLRANKALNTPMAVYPVLRTSDYHDDALGPVASATAIRTALAHGDLTGAASAMPPDAAALLEDAWPTQATDEKALDNLLLHRLRAMTAEEYAALPDLSEGLEQRVMKACRSAASREELLAAVKCKRYTHARISRLCTHALLGMTREMTLAYEEPPYARILGFRRDAAALLTHLKEHARLPLIANPTQLKGHPVFELEARATDIHGLLTHSPGTRRAGRDFTEKMVAL